MVKRTFNIEKLKVYENNVIIISNSLFNRVNQNTQYIIQRMDQLLEQCFNGSWDRCPYDDSCDSYSILLLDDVSQFTIDMFDENDPKTSIKNMLYLLNNNPMIIKSMMTFVQGERGSVEIFDVCTDPSARGRGYVKELMKPVIDSDTNIWLGVKIVDNPYREKILKLYINMGFDNPVLTNTTRDHSFEWPFYNISLSMIKENREKRIWGEDKRTNKEVLEAALELIRNYEQCAFIVRLDNETMRYLWDNFIPDREGVLGRGLEYGGQLILTRGNILVLDRASVHRGDFESVGFELGSYNFHTHHEQCYKKYGCILGWPSATDFALKLRDSTSNILNFVIAIEGIYSFQVTKQFKEFYQSLPNQYRNQLFNATLNYLGEYYEKGSLKLDKPDDPYEFLNVINSATSVGLFQYMDNKGMDDFPYIGEYSEYERMDIEYEDFKLYIVNFAPKDIIFNTNQDMEVVVSNKVNDICLEAMDLE